MLAIYRRMFAEKSHRTSGSSDRTSNSIQQPWFLNLRLMFPVWQIATPQLKLGRSWEHRLIVSHQHSSFFRNCHGPSPFILEMPFSSFYLSSLRLTQGIPRIPWLQLPPVATCSNHSQRGPSLAALIFSRVDVKSNTSPTNPKTRSTYGIPWGENWVMSCLVQFRHAQSVPKVKTLVPAAWWRLEVLDMRKSCCSIKRWERTQGFLEPHHPQRGQRSPQLPCWRIFFESEDVKEQGQVHSMDPFHPFSTKKPMDSLRPRPQTKPKPWDRHIKQKHDMLACPQKVE